MSAAPDRHKHWVILVPLAFAFLYSFLFLWGDAVLDLVPLSWQEAWYRSPLLAFVFFGGIGVSALSLIPALVILVYSRRPLNQISAAATLVVCAGILMRFYLGIRRGLP